MSDSTGTLLCGPRAEALCLPGNPRLDVEEPLPLHEGDPRIEGPFNRYKESASDALIQKHAPNANALMAPLRAAVHQQWPDLDQVGNFYSVSEHMEGPARAASFATNATFAAAYANQSGKSAVVTSVADATDSWAVLIGPPPGWQPSPPITQWDRARGEGRAYWPWFGNPTSKK